MESPEVLDTRTRLLEAAIAVLETDGEVAIRVRDVSADAGVSYASLYHFFEDRDGLIESAQAERFRRSLMETLPPLRIAIEACVSRQELHDILQIGLLGMYSTARADARRSRMEAIASATARPRLAALLQEIQGDYRRAVADTLERPRQQGWVRADIDLEMFALWALGVTTGRALVELDLDGTDGDAWNRIALDGVFAVLLAPEPTAD